MDKKRAIKLPPVLATLGRVIEVDGLEVRYKFLKKDNVGLYATPDGKTLYCLKANKKRATFEEFTQIWERNKTKAEQGVRLFEEWNDFDSKAGSLATSPRGFFFLVDRCRSIIYESPKWEGRNNKYIHDFKTPSLMWVNKKSAPTVLMLSGGKIRTTSRGITG
jgi:hypothetical protein